MDLNKFIDENLDEILNNTSEFVNELTINKCINLKKNNWKDEININSKIIDNQNEDINNIEDIKSELAQQLYNNQIYKKENQINNKEKKDKLDIEDDKDKYEDEDEDEDEDSYYTDDEITDTAQENINNSFLTKILNVFMIHYNEKYEKKDNLFTGIKNISNDTSNQMELFFESIIEFKMLQQKLNLDNEEYNENKYLQYYFNDNEIDSIKEMMDNFKGQIYCLEINNKKILTPSLFVCLNYIIKNKHKECIYIKDWQIYNLREN